ncbi:MAG: CotH kinase family protein [Candidatus Hinthialibacter antarcticus]|nr:CotH kinase family protein [Candidatus Hinthialibacter antarcticus]
MDSILRKRLFAVCLGVLSFVISESASSDILINELLAAASLEDSDGTRLEWIELVNSGSTAISLEGYSLSDDPLAPRKWLLPSVMLNPGGYILIYATGRDSIEANQYHANFQLNRDGETIYLSSSEGGVQDLIQFPNQRLDVSYGRNANGQWRYFITPTPNAANAGEEYIAYLDPPSLSQPGGVYASNLSIVLTPPAPDAELRYTTDGSKPTRTSNRFNIPVPVRRNTVLRVRAFLDGYGPSPIETHTYLVRDEQPLPIISFVSDPNNFFDPQTGLVPNASMHGDNWERPVSVEWIDANGVRQFGVDCGIRIHGGASRGRSPKKSFRLYFRDEYGPTRLRYPLFPDTPRDNFNNVVIRGGFNDTWGYDNPSQRPTAIVVSDQVTRDLHQSMGGVVAHGVFAELFVNGESWGIYNPAERITNVFNEYYFGGDDWDVISDNEANDGDLVEWTKLDAWLLRARRFNNETLIEAGQMIALDAFTDYIIINVWLQNYDWPRHNWYAARERTASGRWRFFLWDAEYSFGSGGNGFRIDQDTTQNAADTNHTSGKIFDLLSKVPEYKEVYWRRLQALQTNQLSPERVHAALDARVNEVRDAIPIEAELYGIAKPPDPAKTPADFEQAVGWAHDFIDQRWQYVLQFTEQHIGPPPVSINHWELY